MDIGFHFICCFPTAQKREPMAAVHREVTELGRTHSVAEETAHGMACSAGIELMTGAEMAMAMGWRRWKKRKAWGGKGRTNYEDRKAPPALAAAGDSSRRLQCDSGRKSEQLWEKARPLLYSFLDVTGSSARRRCDVRCYAEAVPEVSSHHHSHSTVPHTSAAGTHPFGAWRRWRMGLGWNEGVAAVRWI